MVKTLIKKINDLNNTEFIAAIAAASILSIAIVCILYVCKYAIIIGLCCVFVAIAFKKYHEAQERENRKLLKNSLQDTIRDILFDELNGKLGKLLNAEKPMDPDELTMLKQTLMTGDSWTLYRYSFSRTSGSRDLEPSKMQKVFNDYLKNQLKLYPLGNNGFYRDIPVLYVQQVKPDYMNPDFYTIEIAYIDNDTEYDRIRNLIHESKCPDCHLPTQCEDPDFHLPTPCDDPDCNIWTSAPTKERIDQYNNFNFAEFYNSVQSSRKRKEQNHE